MYMESFVSAVGCMRLSGRGAEEYFQRRHSFHQNHTERHTVDHDGEPVSYQERSLPRFVSQKRLSDQCAGPAPYQTHQMQRRLGDSPARILSGRLVPGVDAVRDNARTVIEHQPTHLEPPSNHERGYRDEETDCERDRHGGNPTRRRGATRTHNESDIIRLRPSMRIKRERVTHRFIHARPTITSWE